MKRSLLLTLALILSGLVRLSAQTCLTSNLAAGKTVKASTLQADAHNVTDGNLTTEWQPTVGGAQWIYVDLGQSYTVCKVILKWTTWASDDNWSIQLTSDTTSWGTSIFNNGGTVTTQASGDAYSYHTADLSGSSAAGRYLRISFSNMTAWNARLDEIEVYNKVPLVLPTVSLTAPLDGANYTEGDSVTFTATATESGGTISKVEFYQGSTKIGEDASSPYSFTWTHVPEGEYLITAKATDAAGGSSASTAINVFVDFPDPAWSRTGNTHTTDSNFLGTTDSTKLVLRTKNIKRMTFLPNGNTGIGVDTPTAALHVKGGIRLASLTSDSSKTRVLVSDSAGNLFYRSLSSVGSGGTPGDGLGQSGGILTFGDTAAGPGAYSFTRDRYQFLNGHMYSIGGKTNDPVSRPALTVYDNGDLAVGTTMNRSLTTTDQAGMRYYAKLGILQVGASDRLDTTVSRIDHGSYEGSGIIMNSDDPNILKGRIYASLLTGDVNTLDSGSSVSLSVVATEATHISSKLLGRDLIAGYGHSLTTDIYNSLIIGSAHSFTHGGDCMMVGGYLNAAQDSAFSSVISGENNFYGGRGQTIIGGRLVNRTPFGATLGHSNVDFSTLPYTGKQGITIAQIQQYPLFVLGNGNSEQGAVQSNAMTVLYNGRTQINTTGHATTLSQSDVTPKAALEVVSHNSGVLLPKLTTVQRDSIILADRQNGLLLYNTDSSKFQYYNGSAWVSVGSGSAGSGSAWSPSGNSGTNPSSNFIGTTDSQRVVFKTNNAERMTILANGSIGVGTSTLPATDAKMAVNGTLYSKKVKVTISGWPDFVFAPSYKLTSLPEVEQYIALHHHLPGITAAGEIEKKGLDLGDNQSALLQKIEELTLYLIQQNKQMQDLKEQNEKLQEQNRKLDTLQQQIDELKKFLQPKN